MNKTYLIKYAAVLGCYLWTGFFFSPALFAQQIDSLKTLADFRANTGTWQQASQVTAELDQPNVLKTEKGEGIIVNLPTKKKHGQDLVSLAEFGDIDLDLEFMMASKSNSGIYLMGQYEVQLLDSWTTTQPRAGDLGGIYERWDDSKPEGQKGYDGYAPRQNVARAPGIWQQLHISFRAPRFNAKGEKLQNAKFISVILNGVMIHENLEVEGPTRGAMVAHEIPVGPLRIQGDHGAIAFKNIKITRYETESPKITNLSYEIFKGRFNETPEFASLSADEKGTLPDFQEKTASPSEPHLIRYHGKIAVPASGEYMMRFAVPSGWGSLILNGKKEIDMREGYTGVKTNLEKGQVDFEIMAAKTRDWTDTGMDWEIAGPGLRFISLSQSSTGRGNTVDPILVNERETPILRSFVNLPDGHRVTHAISVSSPQKVHYSYDLEKGNLAQVWRGDFLDATPMWHSRGNGVSRPLGAVVFLGNPESNLLDNKALLIKEEFKSNGYKVGENQIEYSYQIQNVQVKDIIQTRQDGKGFDRIITAGGAATDVNYKIAEGQEIRMIKDGLYLVVDKGFYIQMDPKFPSKPRISKSEDGQQLLVSLQVPIQYSLLF